MGDHRPPMVLGLAGVNVALKSLQNLDTAMLAIPFLNLKTALETDHLARNFFITGVRGEAKRITLPRELVKWDE